MGARRIWSECIINSVKNVIFRVCKLTKVSPVTNKTKWWFVVHTDEGLLSELNTKWDLVKLQTFWKLEPCFMYLNSEGNNTAGAVAISSLTVSGLSMTMSALLSMNKRLTCQHILSKCPSNFPPSHLLLLSKFLTCQRIVLQMSNDLLCNFPNPPLPLLFWTTSEFHTPCWGWKFLFV